MENEPAAPAAQLGFRTWRDRLTWIGVLLLAAAVRAPVLGVGLRHAPHTDEASFVGNVGSMLAAQNLDHRYYEYPGLLFYLLAPVLAPFDGGPRSYLALRVFQAAFSLLSVVLTGLLASRLAGRTAGVAAAVLLAAAPLEAHVAHLFRPDVALQAFVLLALLALERVDGSRRGDVLAGMAVGLATAVKFSGVLAAIGFTVHLLVHRPRAWLRLLLAAAVSVATFAVLSPYTFLAGDRAVARARFQVVYHYVDRGRGESSYAEGLGFYLKTFADGLGWPVVLLAVAGLVVSRASWRRWLPLLATVAGGTALYATAEVLHERFVIPFAGIVCVFAGLAVARLARHHPLLAPAAVVVALAVALARTIPYVVAMRAPTVKDLVADWATATLPPGARIVTTVHGLGFDKARFEVVEVKRADVTAPIVAAGADVVVTTGPATDAPPWPVARVFEPSWPDENAPLVVRRAGAEVTSRLRALTLRPDQVTASGGADVGALVDGDEATGWSTGGPQQPGQSLTVVFDEPTPVARVELALGRAARGYAERLHVEQTVDGATWQRVRWIDGRPPVDEQRGPASQVIVLEPAAVRGLQLLQVGERRRPWSVAELRVWRLDGELAPLPGAQLGGRRRDRERVSPPSRRER